MSSTAAAQAATRWWGSRLKTYGANGSVSAEAFCHTACASSSANAITVRPLRPDLG
jgi:hypothetical protein